MSFSHVGFKHATQMAKQSTIWRQTLLHCDNGVVITLLPNLC